MSYDPTDFANQAGALIEAGRLLHRLGWVPATSGNLSARLDRDTIAVTVSGRHKGELGPEDIMAADMDGRSLQAGRRPSAETLLHTQIYRRFPHAGAVLHTHSISAVVISRLFEGEVVLEDYELLKVFEGVDTHATRLRVPVFPNDQDIARLAGRVDAYMDDNSPLYGYLIAGHGIYTWARDVRTAMHYLEAFEYLFACELKHHEVR